MNYVLGKVRVKMLIFATPVMGNVSGRPERGGGGGGGVGWGCKTVNCVYVLPQTLCLSANAEYLEGKINIYKRKGMDCTTDTLKSAMFSQSGTY